jgi:hypothetical protein
MPTIRAAIEMNRCAAAQAPARCLDPPPAALIRTLGDLMQTDDYAALAAACGVMVPRFCALLDDWIAAGYVRERQDGAVELTERGQVLYVRELERRY